MDLNTFSVGKLHDMSPAQLKVLAAEIREFLIDKVSKTGGHLGPNLGVVELTIAIHRAFESPVSGLGFRVRTTASFRALGL